MKKIVGILIIAISFGVAIPAQAQLKFGFKGGLNLAKADFKASDFESDNFTGFFIGPMAELTLPVLGLGIDGALMYSQRGVKFTKDAVSGTAKENGIEIPINLKYNIGLGSLLGIYIAAGPSFFFNFDDNKVIKNGEFDMKSSQVSINVGAGVKLLKHLQVGAAYNIPLGDSGDVTVSDAVNQTFTSDYKSKTWQVSVAYLF